MNKPQPTISVIGGGIIGSWTALHLVEAGAVTTLFEQFPLPHTRGSSHGQSRAFRFLGDDELDRLEFSLERWQSLERATGETLYLKTGLLDFGPSGDPFLEKHMAVVRDGGRPCEWWEPDLIADRFPMLRFPEKWGAAWDPNGGILFASRCLIYGIPGCEYPGLVKMLFHGGPETDPDSVDLSVVEPYIQQVSDYVRDHLPLADYKEPAVLESCFYTMTPDGNPILDRLPGDVVIGCGFSGSGFKHSPATGWMLAALALDREETLPEGFVTGRYALDRFQNDRS